MRTRAEQAPRPRTIAVALRLPRNDKLQIRVEVCEGADGSRYVAAQAFFLARNGNWLPSRGLNLRQAELAPVAKALLDAERFLAGGAR